MRVLGIESTAHTLGLGIVDNSEILADFRDTYKPKEGGFAPSELFVHHTSVAPELVSKIMEFAPFDAVAWSRGPGIGTALRVGAVLARVLSEKWKLPLVGVNHVVGHIEIAKLLTNSTDPLIVFVSGGNTQIIALAGGRYRVFGETLDIGVGNLLDKFARELGFSFPGGPKLAELAEEGVNYIDLPYSIKGMDVAFSGLLTAAKKKLGRFPDSDLAFSLQETAFSMIVESAERAIAHTRKQELILTGGVAASKRLREMLDIMCSERGIEFKVVPPKFSGDNGSMIAVAGYKMFSAGISHDWQKIDPKWRVDQVEVVW